MKGGDSILRLCRSQVLIVRLKSSSAQILTLISSYSWSVHVIPSASFIIQVYHNLNESTILCNRTKNFTFFLRWPCFGRRWCFIVGVRRGRWGRGGRRLAVSLDFNFDVRHVRITIWPIIRYTLLFTLRIMPCMESASNKYHGGQMLTKSL